MNQNWIDISVGLQDGMPSWPGDPEVKIGLVSRIADGDSANVTQLQMSAHTGTHMDAPVHYFPEGVGIDRLNLSVVMGPARVIPIRSRVAITPEELDLYNPKEGERLLFKTINSEQHWKRSEFVENFVHISKDAARFLAQRRIALAGIDYLSVGGYHNDGDETHRLLISAGVWVIEGLNLEGVEPGHYELICLPIKIIGADGAPARALIRKKER